MYNLMDTTSIVMSVLLFVYLVVFGSFFLLNLILAVLMDNFEQTKYEELEKKHQ